jgi:hypothetical protein
MVDELAHIRFIAAMRESEAVIKSEPLQDLESAFAEIRGELSL